MQFKNFLIQAQTSTAKPYPQTGPNWSIYEMGSKNWILTYSFNTCQLNMDKKKLLSRSTDHVKGFN